MLKTKNRITLKLSIIVFFSIILIIMLRIYINTSLKPVNPKDINEYIVEIPSGSSTSKISSILYENNLIKNEYIFKYYVKKIGKENSLKAGFYTFNKNMSVDDIVELLTIGGYQSNTIDITIIEGLTLEEAAKSLSEQSNLDYDKLLTLFYNIDFFREKYSFLQDDEIISLQGYLLPETYNIYLHSTEEEVIYKILDEFNELYKSQIINNLNNSGLTLNEVITLASIVEKEAMVNEERNIIAGVFINRLKINMRLQSCATVQYALGNWKETLTEDDLEIESDYNTYKIQGLPPGPINSPGIASIIATINPIESEFLFFLSKGDGTHYFTDNYDDFLDAKNKYIHKQ